MKRTLLYLVFAVGAWVLVSFGGAMFDPARANFWTQSLMASLIASLVLAPLLFFVRQQTPASASKKTETPSPASQPAAQSQEDAFVTDEADRLDTLWPQEGDNVTREREHA